MTIKAIETTKKVTTTKAVKTGVQYLSNSSKRAVRVTPSSSVKGAFTLTISNPNPKKELAIILNARDMQAFLNAAREFVVYARS